MRDTARMLEGKAPAAAQEAGRSIADMAKQANSAVNGVADALGLTPRVEANPYASVAVALGIGYVLGGGLFTPTTARLVRMGARLATVPMIRDRLLDVAEAAIDGMVKSGGTQKGN